jgi:hypothetical protein
MRRITVVTVLAALTMVCCDWWVSPGAFADGVRPTKNVRPAPHARKCHRDQCGYPVKCPDGTCYSLYGAYGPHGGALYWSRYTYAGWGYRR